MTSVRTTMIGAAAAFAWWAAGCSTPPVAEGTEPAVTPLERVAELEPEPEPEPSEPVEPAASDVDGAGSSAVAPRPVVRPPQAVPIDADTTTAPEDDTPVSDAGDGRPELDLAPGVPAWFTAGLVVDEEAGRVIAGGTAVAADLRAGRRAALEVARVLLAGAVGEEAAAAAIVDRGAVYPVGSGGAGGAGGGFRVYVLLSAPAPADDDRTED